MNKNPDNLSAQDAEELYKLITGQAPDKAAYAPLAERADADSRFSADLRRRIDAALLGTPAAAPHAALPIGAQIALYALTICAVPALVIGAAQLRTPAAAPATPVATEEPAEQPQPEEVTPPDEVTEDDGLLPAEHAALPPDPKPRAPKLVRQLKKKVLPHKKNKSTKPTAAKNKSAKQTAAKKKAPAAAKKKAAEAKKPKVAAEKKPRTATGKKAAAPKTKQKEGSNKVRSSAPKRTQETPVLSPEEEMQRMMQPPVGATYRVLPRPVRYIRRVRIPAYYRYY